MPLSSDSCLAENIYVELPESFEETETIEAPALPRRSFSCQTERKRSNSETTPGKVWRPNDDSSNTNWRDMFDGKWPYLAPLFYKSEEDTLSKLDEQNKNLQNTFHLSSTSLNSSRWDGSVQDIWSGTDRNGNEAFDMESSDRMSNNKPKGCENTCRRFLCVFLGFSILGAILAGIGLSLILTMHNVDRKTLYKGDSLVDAGLSRNEESYLTKTFCDLVKVLLQGVEFPTDKGIASCHAYMRYVQGSDDVNIQLLISPKKGFTVKEKIKRALSDEVITEGAYRVKSFDRCINVGGAEGYINCREHTNSPQPKTTTTLGNIPAMTRNSVAELSEAMETVTGPSASHKLQEDRKSSLVRSKPVSNPVSVEPSPIFSRLQPDSSLFPLQSSYVSDSLFSQESSYVSDSLFSLQSSYSSNQLSSVRLDPFITPEYSDPVSSSWFRASTNWDQTEPVTSSLQLQPSSSQIHLYSEPAEPTKSTNLLQTPSLFSFSDGLLSSLPPVFSKRYSVSVSPTHSTQDWSTSISTANYWSSKAVEPFEIADNPSTGIPYNVQYPVDIVTDMPGFETQTKNNTIATIGLTTKTSSSEHYETNINAGSNNTTNDYYSNAQKQTFVDDSKTNRSDILQDIHAEMKTMNEADMMFRLGLYGPSGPKNYLRFPIVTGSNGKFLFSPLSNKDTIVVETKKGEDGNSASNNSVLVNDTRTATDRNGNFSNTQSGDSKETDKAQEGPKPIKVDWKTPPAAKPTNLPKGWAGDNGEKKDGGPSVSKVIFSVPDLEHQNSV